METLEQGALSRVAAGSTHTTVTKILRNALEHFSKRGYSGASIREITEASQITKPTLYYYFKNKEELYKCLAKTCFKEAFDVLESSTKFQGSAHDRCLAMIKAYSRFVNERFIVARFLHLMDTSPQRDAPVSEFSNFTPRVFDEFSAVINQGSTVGEFSSAEVVGISYGVMGIFHLYIGTLLSRTALSSEMDGVERALKIIFKRE